MQIVQRPDNTGRATVETGVAVAYPIVAGMTRPEHIGMEIRDCVGNNFFDRSPDSQFTPGVTCERTMTTEDNHDESSPERSPSLHFTRGKQGPKTRAFTCSLVIDAVGVMFQRNMKTNMNQHRAITNCAGAD
jgi:hypothetical protein